MGFLVFAAVWSALLIVAWILFSRGRISAPWHLDIAALGALAVAVLGTFWRVAVGQNWMPADGGDLVSFLFPTYRFAASALRSGTWPLWNPYLYAGAPHVGDIQAGFLYLPNLLLILLWPDFPYTALQWMSMAHIWWAGVGTFFLLSRGLQLKRLPAFVGALAFMLSDVFFTHFGNLNLIAVLSWAPWVFWAFTGQLAWVDRFPQASGDRVAIRWGSSFWFPLILRGTLTGALLSIATTAGHIQGTLFLLLGMAIYAALWCWLRREECRPWRRLLSVVASLALPTVLLVLWSAPILLPALELASHTARTSWNYTQTTGYSLAPAQWIGLLIPGFFGRGPQFHWGAWSRVEVGYIGILPLALAVLTLMMRRDRRTWSWLGLTAVSFVLALGVYAVPHGWLTLLPGFDQLRAPARLVVWTDLGVAVLAAIGLQAVLELPLESAFVAFRRYVRVVGYATAVVLSIVVPLAYLALLVTQDSDPAIVLRVSITLIAVMTFAGLLLATYLWLMAARDGWARSNTLAFLAAAMVLVDLAGNGAYQDLGDRDPSLAFSQPAIASFLSQQPGPFRIDARTDIDGLWQPDTALLYGLEAADGLANPMTLADTDRFWNGLGSRSSRLYDLLNIGFVIGAKDVVLDWSKFELVYDGDPELNVYRNRNVLPRVFPVAELQVVADHEAAWRAIHEEGFDPASVAVVESPIAPPAGHSATITGYLQDSASTTFRVDCSESVLLFVSQMWYPGWQVTIDGLAADEPLRVDYAFQGVVVPAGSHEIRLQFNPISWRVGWMLCGGATLLLLMAGVIWILPARRRASR